MGWERQDGREPQDGSEKVDQDSNRVTLLLKA